MDAIVTTAQIGLALAVGAMSPGPSFIMVSQTALSRRRRAALAAALGMGIGGVVFATLALVGLVRALDAAPVLYVALKVAGGCYLLVVAVRMIRSANQPLAVAGSQEEKHARPVRTDFVRGLITQLANPKTAVVYASVFAALLPRDPSPGVLAGVVLVVFLVESGWYAVVAVALSSGRPRAHYLRAKRWVDRTAGGLLGIIGVRLVLSARQS